MEKRQYEELRETQNTHWWFCGKKKIVIDFACRFAGMGKSTETPNILDVGCGMGLMLDELQKYGNIYGVDMEEYAVNYCKKTFFDYNGKGHIKKGCLPDKIDFPHNHFDYIFALDVLEHVYDDTAALEKLNALLKPGGKIIITVPALMSLWSFNDELNHHFRRYDRTELIKKIKKSRFLIRRCSYYNSLLYPAVFIVRKLKNLMHIQTSDISVAEHGNLINEILKVIFLTEKFWLRRHDFHWGTSLIVIAKKCEK